MRKQLLSVVLAVSALSLSGCMSLLDKAAGAPLDQVTVNVPENKDAPVTSNVIEEPEETDTKSFQYLTKEDGKLVFTALSGYEIHADGDHAFYVVDEKGQTVIDLQVIDREVNTIDRSMLLLLEQENPSKKGTLCGMPFVLYSADNFRAGTHDVYLMDAGCDEAVVIFAGADSEVKDLECLEFSQEE